MHYANFRHWLELKRKELAYVSAYYEDYTIKNYRAANIATEASQMAADLCLHELMRDWGEQAEVLEVDKYLVECLGALPDDPGDKGVYSLDEAAAKLGVSRRTVSRLIEAGDLECTRIGRRVTITQKHLQAYQATEETLF